MLKVPIDRLSVWLIDWFFSLIIHIYWHLLHHSIMDSSPCFQRHKTKKTFPTYIISVYWFYPIYSRSWKGHGVAYLKIGLDSFLNIFKGGILLQPRREVLHVIQQCIKCLTKLQRYMNGYIKCNIDSPQGRTSDILAKLHSNHPWLFLANSNSRI